MRRLDKWEFDQYWHELPYAAWQRVKDECCVLYELGAAEGPDGDLVADMVLVRELRAAGLPVPAGWEEDVTKEVMDE